MKIKFSDLWRWDGTIDRGPYLLLGSLLCAIKYNIDRFVSILVFNRPWGFFTSYIIPTHKGNGILHLSGDDLHLYGTLILIALPFIWSGVVLTLRRLRSAHLPHGLVALFFVPVVNLLLFLILCILPSSEGKAPEQRAFGFNRVKQILDWIIPESAMGSAAMALLIVVPLSFCAVILTEMTLRTYGWTLFIGLPFCHGLASVLLYGLSLALFNFSSTILHNHRRLLGAS